MTVDGPPGSLARSYNRLTLERDRVYYLPLTWTIVHPIDANSPLYGKTAADLERLQAEFLILIKGIRRHIQPDRALPLFLPIRRNHLECQVHIRISH